MQGMQTRMSHWSGHGAYEDRVPLSLPPAPPHEPERPLGGMAAAVRVARSPRFVSTQRPEPLLEFGAVGREGVGLFRAPQAPVVATRLVQPHARRPYHRRTRSRPVGGYLQYLLRARECAGRGECARGRGVPCAHANCATRSRLTPIVLWPNLSQRGPGRPSQSRA